jgi:hypothetical protein
MINCPICETEVPEVSAEILNSQWVNENIFKCSCEFIQLDLLRNLLEIRTTFKAKVWNGDKLIYLHLVFFNSVVRYFVDYNLTRTFLVSETEDIIEVIKDMEVKHRGLRKLMDHDI